MSSKKTDAPSTLEVGAEHTAPVAEPLAIVGIGCRFPGGVIDGRTYWQLLREGRDAITTVPQDRWNIKTYYHAKSGVPGKTNSRWGGFVDNVDRFDAAFFGIAPREAARIDPQQRLLLEVAWEALEDAGQTAARISGSAGGVFIGISTQDYTLIQNAASNTADIDAHSNTGGAMSLAANRLSYSLNLSGPSMAVDTACSSSLVAIHLACRSLLEGECELALAGGVNVLLKPEGYIGFSRASMLAPDGRCKAFDAAANGFVRSEGAGIIILKRLSQARAQRDPIYALIRSTAVNQDGRTAGITVPSIDAQRTLVAEACARAGVAPAEIQYIEAHGTGTEVGDPVEAEALGTVIGQSRDPDQPCAIGSVKTNIGHLEPAAGVAGLIKVALALKHQQLPPHLHFTRANPKIPLHELGLRVPQKLEPWPPHHGPALAGVNSFGFGGTNAHAVLQEYLPAPEELTTHRDENGDRANLFVISARSADALDDLAKRYRDALSPQGTLGDVDLVDLCYSASHRRDHHEHRLAIAARTREDLLDSLQAHLTQERRPTLVSNRALGDDRPQVAVVFSGQGPQWWAMGRELLREEPVFRDTVRRCDAIISDLGAWSLLDELGADEAGSRMQVTAIAQPAIFALQAGLVELYRSWGIEPAAIIGHSVGEIAACYAAGVLDIEAATRVIYHRGRCMEFANAEGGMLAVGLPAEQASSAIGDYADEVCVAAINAPESVTLSGNRDALDALKEMFDGRDVFCRALRVNYAFHSFHMDAARDELLKALQGLQPRPAKIPIYSTVTGAQAEGQHFDAEYWWRNVRQPVRFADGLLAVLERPLDALLELSPHPVLASPAAQCLAHARKKATVLASLRRQEDEAIALRAALGALHTLGARIKWDSLYPQGRCVRLPAYPWQRERYWNEAQESRRSRTAALVHPLLGRRMAGPLTAWENRLDVQAIEFLNDHCIDGRALLSGTVFVELALAAARDLSEAGPWVFEEIELHKACFISEQAAQSIQTVFDSASSSISVYSKVAQSQQDWILHTRGKLRSGADVDTVERLDLAELRDQCTCEVAVDECYARLEEVGLEYGPTYRGIAQLWKGPGQALGLVCVPEALGEDTEDYVLHPAILDACLQVTSAAIDEHGTSSSSVYMPVEFEQLRIHAPLGERVWSHCRLIEHGRRELRCDVHIFDESGKPLVEVRGFRAAALDTASVSNDEQLDDLLYAYRWELQPLDQSRESLTAVQLPRPRALLETCSVSGVDDAMRQSQARYMARVDRLCSSYVARAFQELGWDMVPGESLPADALLGRLGIAARHGQVVERYLAMLQEDGILKRSAGAWTVCARPETDDTQAAWAGLLAEYPACYAELTLLARCSQQLSGVLRGDIDPLQLIFPDGSLAIAEHLYQDSPTLRLQNLLARRVIREAVRGLPEHHTLRVLEIGAGTGGLTSHILPELPPRGTRYVFTDLSKHFFIKAEQKFRACPFMECAILDIEQDPRDQGFAESGFDIIMASEVLHATVDLGCTLEHIKTLLAPGGLLMIVEGVQIDRWVDLIFGLTEGWWRFSDRDLRPDYPLLSLSRWQQLLIEMGFEEACEASGLDEAEVENAVIVARSPAVAAPPAQSAPLEVQGDMQGDWLIFADRHGVAERLAARLTHAQGRCHLIYAEDHGAGEPGTWQAPNGEAVQALLQRHRPNCRGILHFWSLDAPSAEEGDNASLEHGLELGCLHLTHVAQALAGWEHDAALPRLWLVTRGAQTLGDGSEAVAFEQTPTIGLGRVLINEFPQLRATLVDLGGAADDREIDALVKELCADEHEDEIALRGTRRYVHRFVRCPTEPLSADALDDDGIATGFRLEISKAGMIDHLRLRQVDRPAPAAGEVEIRVATAGLNFADVMKALGIYPGLGDGAIPLGNECAGTISGVGSGVSEFAVGDAVLAIAPRSFGSHVLTSADLVVPRPPRIGEDEGATLPITYLTAYYAMVHTARLAAGERVLIHSATGGVGLAALYIARWIGAEILATAGTTEKRDFLHLLGIKHVMDSRSLAFVDQVRAATGGEGVDVVLNSLAGEALRASLGLLRNYGRFLEIGKRDIYQDSGMGLRPFKRNLSFAAIDLDLGLRERPQLFAGLFREIMAHVAQGDLHALPHRVFPMSEVTQAFRYLSQAKHIGKVVVRVEDEPLAIVPARRAATAFREQATYLLTGGLGGFGLATARWMVESGARHIVLMGRRGVHSPECQESVEQLRQLGAEVTVAQADVTDKGAVAKVLADIKQRMPPLAGVLHAAMVLDDCLLLNLNRDRLFKVAAPKIHGAWLLHRLTQHEDLDFFVMFSSMSSMFGISGQGNYSAANAFLDGLAHYRTARGLPALAVNWGSIGAVGYVARNEDIIERFAREGVHSVQPGEALTLLGRLLDRKTVQMGVVRFDWQRWRGFTQTEGLSPRFAALARYADQYGAVHAEDEHVPAASALLAAAPEQRFEVLMDLLSQQVARVLGAARDKLDVTKPLTQLGLDSLMGVELRNWIESELRLNLPTVELMRGPSVVQLAELLNAQLGQSAPTDMAAGAPAAMDQQQQQVSSRHMLAIAPLPRSGALPLSFAQQRLWMLEQLLPGATAVMNNVVAVRLHGALDESILQRSIDAVICRHESLRTRFSAVDGQPQQIIAPDGQVDFEQFDLRALGKAQCHSEVQRMATQQAQQPFDLATDLLLRVALIQVADREHVLVAVTHHIVADGWSTAILVRDWVEMYRALSAGTTPALPELRIQYADFAHWQRQRLQGDLRDELLNYWTDHLGGDLPVLQWPSRDGRSAAEDFQGATRTYLLDAALCQGARDLAQREGCTLFMVLFAAFNTLLHRHTGACDIIVGAPHANRTHAETEELIGFLANTLIMRTDLSDRPTFQALLQRVRDQLLSAQAHQELPVEVLLEALRPHAASAEAPLFQVMFNLLNVPFPEIDLPGLRAVEEPVDIQLASCDLHLMLRPRGLQLEATVNYKTALFQAADIDGLMSHFRNLLASACTDAQLPVTRLQMMDPEEQARRTAALPGEATDHTEPGTICILFEAQVARTPDAAAAIFENGSMTFGQLNDRANLLAGRLQAHGVRCGAAVGLCAEHHEGRVVGMLGILKAGAGCLLLDADWPHERLAAAVNEAGAEVVVLPSALVPRFDQLGPELVCLEDGTHSSAVDLPSAGASQGPAFLRCELNESAAVVEGVNHQALLGHCRSFARAIELSAQDRMVCLPGLDPTAVPLRLLSCWLSGAAVILWDEAMWYSPEDLRQRLELEAPTIVCFESGEAHSATETFLGSGQPLPDSVRLLLTDGLVRRPKGLQALRNRKKRVPWVNTLSLGSSLMLTTLYRDDADLSSTAEGRLPIGRPLANKKLYVLGPDLQVLPAGMAGELCIAGAAAAPQSPKPAGGQEDRWVADPFVSDASSRLYRTHRSARYRHDGQIELL